MPKQVVGDRWRSPCQGWKRMRRREQQWAASRNPLPCGAAPLARGRPLATEAAGLEAAGWEATGLEAAGLEAAGLMAAAAASRLMAAALRDSFGADVVVSVPTLAAASGRRAQVGLALAGRGSQRERPRWRLRRPQLAATPPPPPPPV